MANVEIERKFLIKDTGWFEGAVSKCYIEQGYLSTSNDVTVRVRSCVMCDKNTGYITIKGKTVGISRPEYEYEIPYEHANELLQLIPKTRIVKKIRHEVANGADIWEVDSFLDSNKGLVIAEIELPSENATFSIPSWLGDEVSHDYRYTNKALSEKPFTTWPENKQIDRDAIETEVFDKLVSVLRSERFLYTKASSITMSTDLKAVLDSLDITEVSMEMEDAFDIEMDQDEINSFVTVADVVCKVVDILIEKTH